MIVNSHGSSSVYKVNLEDRMVSRIAGTGLRGNADGPADEATFSRPNGVALSTTGDTLFLNSSIPLQDDPGNNSFPLNPSVLRMATGLSSICTPSSGLRKPPSWGLQLFPNPTTGRLALSLGLSQSDDIHLSVFDATGKQVHAERWGELPGGQHLRVLQLDGLPGGNYFLLATGRSQAKTLPFQLEPSP